MSPAAATIHAQGGFTRTQLRNLAAYAQTCLGRAEKHLEALSPTDPRYGSAHDRMEARLATLVAYTRAYMAMPEEGSPDA